VKKYNSDGYKMKHQWHGWARSEKKSEDEFEENSYVGINRDLP